MATTTSASNRLRRALKETKRKRWWNVFGSSKYNSSNFQSDKGKVIALYNEKGFRNATIVKDSISFVSEQQDPAGHHRGGGQALPLPQHLLHRQHEVHHRYAATAS